MSNPGSDDIEAFLQEGLQELDKLLPKYLGEIEGIVRYVFTYAQGDITLQFAVRRDAVPVYPRGEGAA